MRIKSVSDIDCIQCTYTTECKQDTTLYGTRSALLTVLTVSKPPVCTRSDFC